MVQTSYPGVYIQEVPSGVNTITGVSTSIAAFFGRTARGPLNKAVRCLSLADFNRAFGGPHPESDLAQSVKMFFDNGGNDCYVVRLAANAQTASLTLTDITRSSNVLIISAKTAGVWGNGIRLEIDYNTPNPDESFNLTVIQEEAGVEVAQEQHLALTMDPQSPRFAPTFVSQSSSFIDVDLHSDVRLGGPRDLRSTGAAGFSQSLAFQVSDADFRQDFEDMLNNNPSFEMSVDEEQYVPISLANVFDSASDIAPSAWTLTEMATRLQQVINLQLNALVPGASVLVTWVRINEEIVDADVDAIRITANSGDSRSVRIRRTGSNDFAVLAGLGVEQGGIEVTRHSAFRPVPTASFFHDPNSVLGMASLARDVITAITIDGGVAIPLDFSDMPAEPGKDFWLNNNADTRNGVREKLRRIAQTVNDDANIPWRAEVWGYHLAFVAQEGSINSMSSGIVFSGDSDPEPLLGSANFTHNVRRYTLGNTGTSNFQRPITPGTLENVGTDGSAPTLNEFIGDIDRQIGFHALDSVDLFNLMIIPSDEGVPDNVHQTLWGHASTYCEQHRAFLLIDPPTGWTSGNDRPNVIQNTDLVNDLRAVVVKDHSAVFYPNLSYRGLDGLIRSIGPSGAIAGLMARIDSTRGVWKAPAGTEADIRGINGLEVKLTDRENGVLNKLGVNCLRVFPSGFVNWGARTLDGSDDIGSEWKYIPIRRLALFLEESLFRGTKWVVFEPNDEPLWAKIRLNLNAFMMGLFRQGAFQGSTPNEAFYVKCDSETTTQNDRNLGIVNIEVGFAPLKPAEFVIIKIQQIIGDL